MVTFIAIFKLYLSDMKMKRLLPAIVLVACGALFGVTNALASGSIFLRGYEYKVDTVFHNVVGPGTTQTQLHVTREGAISMYVFYCTMDMTNPYLTLGGACSTDNLAGKETISGIAQRKSREGAQYYVGINGDFFLISGKTARGLNMAGTPYGPTVVGGQVFRARREVSEYKSFTQAVDGSLHVNPISYSGTLTGPDGASAELGGINIDGMDNFVIIYNHEHYGATNQAAGGWEVETRVADGEAFKAAGEFHLVVTGAPSDAGDMTVPADRYVLRGQGAAASFIKGLKEGDVITANATWTVGGVTVDPKEVVSGNPKILENGVVLESEGDRGDASARHPRTAIGYSDGGSKVYFLVVDGRSSISGGCRTTFLGEFMRYVGASEAVNLDGGGSSILYTQALGVRNVPSDGYERADGNAFYAIHSAPADDAIASLRFADYKLEAPLYGVYVPRIYGYNRYGVMVDNDVKGFTLTCSVGIGKTPAPDTFIGTSAGVGTLTATLGEASVTLPIAVSGDMGDMKLTCDSVLNDTYREWPVLVENAVDGNVVYLDPAALTWTSSDENVVTIDANTGVLRGVDNGEATVTGTVGDFTGSMRVIVEKPTSRTMSAIAPPVPDDWKLTMSGGKNTSLTALGDGFHMEYTGSSTRSAYIKLARTLRLWSLPDEIRLRFNPHNVAVTKVTLALRTPGSAIVQRQYAPESIPQERESVFSVVTADWMDAADLTRYPITLEYVQFTIEKPTVGEAYSLDITGLETIYNNVMVEGDVNNDGVLNGVDVTSLYGHLLSGGAVAGRADVNGDGVVNGADLTALYSLLLKGD